MDETKSAQERDYYEILGIPETATQKEIKKAYRRLAQEWHPDKWERAHPNATKEQKNAITKKFAEINTANETLSDIKKREDYDIGRKANAQNTSQTSQQTSQRTKQQAQQRTQNTQQRAQNSQQGAQQRSQHKQQTDSRTNTNSRSGTQGHTQSSYKSEQRQERTPHRAETPHSTGSNSHWGIVMMLLLAIGFFGYRHFTMGKLVINMPYGSVVIFEKDGATVAKRETLPCKISLKEGMHRIKIIAGNKYWIGDVKVAARQEIKPAGNIKAWQTTSKKSAKTKVRSKRAGISATKNLQKNSIKTHQATQDKATVTPQQENTNKESIEQQEMEAARKKREENLRRIQEAEQQ